MGVGMQLSKLRHLPHDTVTRLNPDAYVEMIAQNW
jgi:hypothetical protein